MTYELWELGDLGMMMDFSTLAQALITLGNWRLSPSRGGMCAGFGWGVSNPRGMAAVFAVLRAGTCTFLSALEAGRG